MKSWHFLLCGMVVGIASAAEPAQPGWQVDAAVRFRVESREQNFTFDQKISSPTDDTWLLTRVRVGLKGTLADGLLVYGQVQDAREFGSDRPRVPFIMGSEGNDPLDLRQLYVEKTSPAASLRLGRQIIALGDERLVGPSDWSNFSRTFDAVRLTLPKVGAGLDVFISSVVQTQPGGVTGWHANHSSADDLFGGVYSRFALSDTLKIEPYVLWRHKTSDVIYNVPGVASSRPYDIPQKIATFGVRWTGGPAEKLGGFDYDGEIAGQTGEARARQQVGAAFVYPGPAWLRHEAWALHTGAGYTTNAVGFPLRFYAEINHATGDRNPADHRDQSFYNLFPTNHKFYGNMDVLAWKNMTDVALAATATFTKTTKVRLESHAMALANTNDTWFRSNGTTTVRALTPAARAASRTAGEETDLVITHTINPHVAIDGGASYFATGRYLAQTGGASDARFFYVQSVFQW